MKILFSILLVLCSITSVFAGDKPSDEAIKKKLLGYWDGPRHDYLINPNGIMYTCPRRTSTTTYKWDVRDGHFYQHGNECKIITLTNGLFVYREVNGHHATYTLVRTTEKLAEDE